MFARQVRLARGISQFLFESLDYTLLAQKPSPTATLEARNMIIHAEDIASGVQFQKTHIIVLFHANQDKINTNLVKRINATRKMYVSGTTWAGRPACRVAVSTWKVDVDRDLKLVTEVLEQALKGDPEFGPTP